MCAAGWFDRGHVGYPIVKPGANCGFGKIGVVDYGVRRNKSERWDVYCYNPDCEYMFLYIAVQAGFKEYFSHKMMILISISYHVLP